MAYGVIRCSCMRWRRCWFWRLAWRVFSRQRFAEGDRFRIFVLAYFSWRLLVDFLKPGVRFADLTVLQWACAAAVLWYSRDLWRIVSEAWKPKEALAHG